MWSINGVGLPQQPEKTWDEAGSQHRDLRATLSSLGRHTNRHGEAAKMGKQKVETIRENRTEIQI